MEYIGIKWNQPRENMMLTFCGQDRCLVDGNGRIKLSQHFVDDFLSRCGGEVVMHGLPEGAIAIYPEEVYKEMRRREIGEVEAAGNSFVIRQSMRRFGALSQSEVISKQGRVTLPVALREYAGLFPGEDACVIGVEIGIEIWSRKRYEDEMKSIKDYMDNKRIKELEAVNEHQ